MEAITKDRTLLKRLLTLLLILSIPSVAGAQSTVKVKLTDGTRQWYEQLPVPHKTADKAFWVSTLLSVGLTVADAENTKYALGRPGATESNPLFGKNPSRARMYGIMLPIAGLTSYYSFRYKREDDALKAAGYGGHKYVKWWLPNLFNTAEHALGVGVTLGFTGR